MLRVVAYFLDESNTVYFDFHFSWNIILYNNNFFNLLQYYTTIDFLLSKYGIIFAVFVYIDIDFTFVSI